MSLDRACVSVIIAAYNAEQTVDIAIRSALNEPQVGEIILVDDCSSDQTCARALSASAGDPRLHVVRQSTNGGPARARNLAISKARMPLIALLDADDAFVAGRFSRLPALSQKWDFWADNVLFVKKTEDLTSDLALKFDISQKYVMNTISFIEGNIPKRGMLRAELGFLKPVFKRSFIEKLNLTYRDDCRLGEDFLFYTEALSSGAIFFVDGRCGYRALHRSNSLSGLHDVKDLIALRSGVDDLLARLQLTREERSSLERHRRSLQGRIAYRQVLMRRAEFGLLSGITALATNPRVIFALINDRLNPVKVDECNFRPLLFYQNLNHLENLPIESHISITPKADSVHSGS